MIDQGCIQVSRGREKSVRLQISLHSPVILSDCKPAREPRWQLHIVRYPTQPHHRRSDLSAIERNVRSSPSMSHDRNRITLLRLHEKTPHDDRGVGCSIEAMVRVRRRQMRRLLRICTVRPRCAPHQFDE